MKGIIVIGAQNITKQGLTLKLNKPAKLNKSGIKTDEWWVSWDTIGKALFPDSYSDLPIEGIDKLRKQAQTQEDNHE